MFPNSTHNEGHSIKMLVIIIHSLEKSVISGE